MNNWKQSTDTVFLLPVTGYPVVSNRQKEQKENFLYESRNSSVKNYMNDHCTTPPPVVLSLSQKLKVYPARQPSCHLQYHKDNQIMLTKIKSLNSEEFRQEGSYGNWVNLTAFCYQKVSYSISPLLYCPCPPSTSCGTHWSFHSLNQIHSPTLLWLVKFSDGLFSERSDKNQSQWKESKGQFRTGRCMQPLFATAMSCWSSSHHLLELHSQAVSVRLSKIIASCTDSWVKDFLPCEENKLDMAS